MLQSVGLQSVEHDLANEQRFTHFYGGFAYSLYFFKVSSMITFLLLEECSLKVSVCYLKILIYFTLICEKQFQCLYSSNLTRLLSFILIKILFHDLLASLTALEKSAYLSLFVSYLYSLWLFLRCYHFFFFFTFNVIQIYIISPKVSLQKELRIHKKVFLGSKALNIIVLLQLLLEADN